MSGIALIIPGADFSGSPLGQVTFIKPLPERAAEAVAAYATAIGSHTYDTELINLVSSLMALGVWDKISVFPMLGDTVEKKMEPLNQSNDSTVKTLFYPNTVTVNDGELLFVNSPTSPTYGGTLDAYSDISGLKTAFKFIDFIRTSGSPNTSGATSGDLALGTTTSGDGVAARLQASIPSAVHSSIALPISGTGRHTFACHIDTSKASVYVDGELNEETAINDVATNYRLNNIIGSSNSVGAENVDLYAGIIRMYAFGLIDTDIKAKSTIDALQVFLAAVKP